MEETQATQSIGDRLGKLRQLEAQFMASNPKMSESQKTAISNMINQKRAKLYIEGGVQPGDIPTENITQSALEQQLVQGEYQSPEAVKAAQKLETEGKGVLGLIDTLKMYYNQPNLAGVSPVSGKEDLSKGSVGTWNVIPELFMKGKIALNMAPDAATYKRMKEGFTASLKEATGDTGVLTDKDYVRIANTMPNFGDDDETARKAWEGVDQILMAKFGRVGKFSYLQPTATKTSTVPTGDGGGWQDIGGIKVRIKK